MRWNFPNAQYTNMKIKISRSTYAHYGDFCGHTIKSVALIGRQSSSQRSQLSYTSAKNAVKCASPVLVWFSGMHLLLYGCNTIHTLRHAVQAGHKWRQHSNKPNTFAGLNWVVAQVNSLEYLTDINWTISNEREHGTYGKWPDIFHRTKESPQWKVANSNWMFYFFLWRHKKYHCKFLANDSRQQ